MLLKPEYRRPNPPETIPVPKNLLRRLRRVLEELSSFLDEETAEVPGNGSWSFSEVELARVIILDLELEAAFALTEAMSKTPDVWVPSAIVWGPEPEARNQMRQELARFSYALRQALGEKRLPFKKVQRNSGYFYMMPKKIAEWWKAAS